MNPKCCDDMERRVNRLLKKRFKAAKEYEDPNERQFFEQKALEEAYKIWTAHICDFPPYPRQQAADEEC